MRLQTLEGVPINKILEAFNNAFSDYFVPLQLTETQLVTKMKADKVDLSLSVGAFENDTLIAFILHGFDTVNNQKLVYNGGTGVIPSKRGTRLTQRMYEYIVPILKSKGIHSVILEVIDKNIPAIKSYTKAGFNSTRTLACYKGECRPIKSNEQITIKKLEEYSWNEMTTFWDIQPTWQNSNRVLSSMQSEHSSLGAYFMEELVGYAIFNPSNYRIQQIAVDKSFRRKGIASALLSQLLEESQNDLSIINVDTVSKNIHSFFTSIGLKNYLGQLEMELVLKTD